MAKAFEYKDTGLGLGQFTNGDVALVGGFRTGKLGTPGTMRLLFGIYDIPLMNSGAPGGLSKMGSVEINMLPCDPGETPDIEGLVDITLSPGCQGRGLGRRVVEALAASSAEGLRIYDIKRKAVPFWKAVGCNVVPATRAGGLVGSFEPPTPAPAFSP